MICFEIIQVQGLFNLIDTMEVLAELNPGIRYYPPPLVRLVKHTMLTPIDVARVSRRGYNAVVSSDRGAVSPVVGHSLVTRAARVRSRVQA